MEHEEGPSYAQPHAAQFLSQLMRISMIRTSMHRRVSTSISDSKKDHFCRILEDEAGDAPNGSTMH